MTESAVMSPVFGERGYVFSPSYNPANYIEEGVAVVAEETPWDQVSGISVTDINFVHHLGNPAKMRTDGFGPVPKGAVHPIRNPTRIEDLRGDPLVEHLCRQNPDGKFMGFHLSKKVEAEVKARVEEEERRKADAYFQARGLAPAAMPVSTVGRPNNHEKQANEQTAAAHPYDPAQQHQHQQHPHVADFAPLSVATNTAAPTSWGPQPTAIVQQTRPSLFDRVDLLRDTHVAAREEPALPPPALTVGVSHGQLQQHHQLHERQQPPSSHLEAQVPSTFGGGPAADMNWLAEGLDHIANECKGAAGANTGAALAGPPAHNDEGFFATHASAFVATPPPLLHHEGSAPLPAPHLEGSADDATTTAFQRYRQQQQQFEQRISAPSALPDDAVRQYRQEPAGSANTLPRAADGDGSRHVAADVPPAAPKYAEPRESAAEREERQREADRMARENIIKRNLIVRLDRLRMRKCNVTKYTMSDSAVDMQNELDRHYCNAALEQDMKNTMSMVKVIGIGVHGVNTQLLHTGIDTHDFPKEWEQTMDDCMPAFEELYHQYKGRMGVRSFNPKFTIFVAVAAMLVKFFFKGLTEAISSIVTTGVLPAGFSLGRGNKSPDTDRPSEGGGQWPKASLEPVVSKNGEYFVQNADGTYTRLVVENNQQAAGPPNNNNDDDDNKPAPTTSPVASRPEKSDAAKDTAVSPPAGKSKKRAKKMQLE
jgi:hypothetical protein